MGRSLLLLATRRPLEEPQFAVNDVVARYV
jgi:hypothetical protein